MFVAISHGQNRGILKKGKFDEREKFINEFNIRFTSIKICSIWFKQF